MLKKSILQFAEKHVILLRNRNRCIYAAVFVIIQCIVIFIGSATIRHCVWSPSPEKADFDNLARIMYLYDYKACGHKLRKVSSIANLILSNETYSFDVLPIQWTPAMVTVSTRLSAKTRTYINISIALHTLWMIAAMILWAAVKWFFENHNIIKIALNIFFYLTVLILIFDSSMAIVYIAHIKQSLSKGMILRYSGWSVELKLKSYEDFAGWIPIIACACWLKGVFITGFNVWCMTIILSVMKQMHKGAVTRRLMHLGNLPIPEAQNLTFNNNKSVLHFRTDEHSPQIQYRDSF